MYTVQYTKLHHIALYTTMYTVHYNVHCTLQCTLYTTLYITNYTSTRVQSSLCNYESPHLRQRKHLSSAGAPLLASCSRLSPFSVASRRNFRTCRHYTASVRCIHYTANFRLGVSTFLNVFSCGRRLLISFLSGSTWLWVLATWGRHSMYTSVFSVQCLVFSV